MPSRNLSPTPTANPISTGDRLRVTHDSQCCANPSIGVEQSLTSDSLVLQPEIGTQRVPIPRASITQIERWNAGRTHKAAGALYGLLIGASSGALVGYSTACAHCDGDWRPLGAIAGSIVGGGAGSLVGLAVGTAHRGFWEIIH
jgi:hypothetical protein